MLLLLRMGMWVPLSIGEDCGLVLLLVGECGVLGRWRLGMLCVPWIGGVGHKWTPNIPPGTTPLVSCSSRGEGLVFEVLPPPL